MTVDAQRTVAEAHDLAHHAEVDLLAFVPRLTAATIHVSPDGAHAHPVPARDSAETTSALLDTLGAPGRLSQPPTVG